MKQLYGSANLTCEPRQFLSAWPIQSVGRKNDCHMFSLADNRELEYIYGYSVLRGSKLLVTRC